MRTKLCWLRRSTNKKARGLNKKIVNPQPKQRKHLREFCYVLKDQGSVPLNDWLNTRGLSENDCGLVAVNHAVNTYALFHNKDTSYRGLFSKKDDAALLCSSVPIEAQPIAWLTCNKNAFKAHCKAHHDYWDWVSHRNEDRYLTNVRHDRGYDSKNMMHTLRLLDMAIEIAEQGILSVKRPNAKWLLQIKAGELSYEDLLCLAEEKLERVSTSFKKSPLPESVDFNEANQILTEVRNAFFQNA